MIALGLGCAVLTLGFVLVLALLEWCDWVQEQRSRGVRERLRDDVAGAPVPRLERWDEWSRDV